MQTRATVFPSGNALGLSWDAALLRTIGATIGEEARATHNGAVHAGNRGAAQNGVGITLYSPNMNLVRNPLWGRAQEVYSEGNHMASSTQMRLFAQPFDCCLLTVRSVPVVGADGGRGRRRSADGRAVHAGGDVL